jgi:hypothetical protein
VVQTITEGNGGRLMQSGNFGLTRGYCDASAASGYFRNRVFLDCFGEIELWDYKCGNCGVCALEAGRVLAAAARRRLIRLRIDKSAKDSRDACIHTKTPNFDNMQLYI